MKTNYEQHMQELASLVNGLSQAEAVELLRTLENNKDLPTKKAEYLDKVRYINSKSSHRQHISVKRAAEDFDALHSRTAEQVAADEADEIRRHDELADVGSAEIVQRLFEERMLDQEGFANSLALFRELLIRREFGLIDILDGKLWMDSAQERITTLNKHIEAITPVTWQKIQAYVSQQVPDLPPYESVIGFVRENAPILYRGESNDLKQFIAFVGELALKEAHRRVFMHKVIEMHTDQRGYFVDGSDESDESDAPKQSGVSKQQSGPIYAAIDRVLYKTSDLISDQCLQTDELFWQVIYRVYEEADSLMQPAKPKVKGRIPTFEGRLFSFARKQTLDYTKALTEQAKEERQLMADDLYGFQSIFPEPEADYDDETGKKIPRTGARN